MIQKTRGKYRFFYHYFKQKDKWSVHFRGRCYVVDDLECQVPAEGHKQSRQPRRIIRGYAKTVLIFTHDNNKKAVIQ